MDFRALKREFVALQLDEIRMDADKSFEFVMAADRAEEFQKVFEKYFGSPMKPRGRRANRSEKRIAFPYGGIRVEQTLFFKDGETSCYIGLLWPWGNGESVTVKIYADEPAVPASAGLWERIKKILPV